MPTSRGTQHSATVNVATNDDGEQKPIATVTYHEALNGLDRVAQAEVEGSASYDADDPRGEVVRKALARRRSKPQAEVRATPREIGAGPGVARFVATGKAYRIKVALDPEGGDDDLALPAIGGLQSEYIEFTDGEFLTKNAAVIKFLRSRLRLGQYPDVHEDAEAQSIPCRFCGQTFRNSAQGRIALMEHEQEHEAA